MLSQSSHKHVEGLLIVLGQEAGDVRGQGPKDDPAWRGAQQLPMLADRKDKVTIKIQRHWRQSKAAESGAWVLESLERNTAKAKAREPI